MDRGPGRAEVHTRPAEMQIVLGLAGKKRDIARRLGQHVFDKRGRKPEAPVRAEHGSGLGHGLDPGRGCLGQADHLEGLECGTVDLRQRGLRERAVLSARQSRPHRPQFVGKGRGPQRTARCAPARPGGAPLAGIGAFDGHSGSFNRPRRRYIRVRSAVGSYIGRSAASAGTGRPATSISYRDDSTSSVSCPGHGT